MTTRRILRNAALAAPMLYASLAGVARVDGDEVVLNNGSRFEGRLSERGTSYVIRTEHGEISVPRDSVTRVSVDSVPPNLNLDALVAKVAAETDPGLPAADRAKQWLDRRIDCGEFRLMARPDDSPDPVALCARKEFACAGYGRFIAELHTALTGGESLLLSFDVSASESHLVAMVGDRVYDALLRGTPVPTLDAWLNSPIYKLPRALYNVEIIKGGPDGVRRRMLALREPDIDDAGFFITRTSRQECGVLRRLLSGRLSLPFESAFDPSYRFVRDAGAPLRDIRVVNGAWAAVDAEDGLLVPSESVLPSGAWVQFAKARGVESARFVGWSVYGPDGTLLRHIPDESRASYRCGVKGGSEIFLGDASRFNWIGWAPSGVFKLSERHAPGVYTILFGMSDGKDYISVGRAKVTYER